MFLALGTLQPPLIPLSGLPSASGLTSILGVTPWLHNQALVSLKGPAGQVLGRSTSKRVFFFLFSARVNLIASALMSGGWLMATSVDDFAGFFFLSYQAAGEL